MAFFNISRHSVWTPGQEKWCFTGQQDYIVAMLSEGIAFIGIVFLLNIVLDKTHISQAQMNLTMYKVNTLLCKQ